MREKYTLERYDDNELVSTKNYKTLKEIAIDCPDLDYMVLRQIYLYHSNKKVPKFLHSSTKDLMSKFKITDKK